MNAVGMFVQTTQSLSLVSNEQVAKKEVNSPRFLNFLLGHIEKGKSNNSLTFNQKNLAEYSLNQIRKTLSNHHNLPYDREMQIQMNNNLYENEGVLLDLYSQQGNIETATLPMNILRLIDSIRSQYQLGNTQSEQSDLQQLIKHNEDYIEIYKNLTSLINRILDDKQKDFNDIRLTEAIGTLEKEHRYLGENVSNRLISNYDTLWKGNIYEQLESDGDNSEVDSLETMNTLKRMNNLDQDEEKHFLLQLTNILLEYDSLISNLNRKDSNHLIPSQVEYSQDKLEDINLNELYKENEKIEKQLNELVSKLYHELHIKLDSSLLNSQFGNEEIERNFQLSSISNHTNKVQNDTSHFQQQLTFIQDEFEMLLVDLNNQEKIKRVSPKVMELLQRWAELENQFSHQHRADETVMKPFSLRVDLIWKKILQAYQKRNQMISKNQYQNESKVTTKDIISWIENAIKSQQSNDLVKTSQVYNFYTNLELPQVQQYYIFMNQNQKTDIVSKQLVEQFQQVISMSKFLSMPNGIKQLSISLRPENLGDLMVRLIEINGEMTVKIMVSSKAAKEILESNINQLRHMFSPNQIVIERLEISTNSNESQAEKNEEHTDNNDSNNKSDDPKKQEKKNNGDDFISQLDELLENMKV